MKIDQEILSSLSTNTHELNSEIMVVKYFETEILVDKKGAKQLIEILKEFIGDECKRIAVDENGECLHFHTTFGRGECFDCGKKLKESTNEN